MGLKRKEEEEEEEGGDKGVGGGARTMSLWGEGFCPRSWVSLAWACHRQLPRCVCIVCIPSIRRVSSLESSLGGPDEAGGQRTQIKQDPPRIQNFTRSAFLVLFPVNGQVQPHKVTLQLLYSSD